MQNGPVWATSGAPIRETMFIARRPNGQIALDLAGFPNTSYVLQAGTNLLDWVGVITNQTGPNGLLNFIDTPTAPWRFYRATLPPTAQ